MNIKGTSTFEKSSYTSCFITDWVC